MKHFYNGYCIEFVVVVKRFKITYPDGFVLWTNSFKIVRETVKKKKTDAQLTLF